MKKKLLSKLLIATVLCSITTSTAFASETTAPGTATSAAVLTAEATLFCVTVPTSVLIYVKSNGDVITPDTVPIINNSAGPVVVNSLAVITKNEWILDLASTDYSHFKVGLKNFKMNLNGQDPSAGALTFPTPINGSESLNLALSADVSPQKEAITATQIGEMVVTVGWYEDETVPDAPVIPEGYIQASDADFSGDTDGSFHYIGNNELVVVPDTIKGVAVTSYHDMFYGTAVKGVVSTNPNITDMSRMFCLSTATTLDLSNLNTSSVTDMGGMFMYSAATTIDLSNFNTANVTAMWSMFADTAATSIDLSSFNTTNVTNMTQMFGNAVATVLDLSSFDTTNTTNLSYMFSSADATVGYAKTQADADKFNTTESKPAGLTFTVK